MSAEMSSYLPLIVLGLVLLVVAVWVLSRATRKAKVIRDDSAAPLARDVLAEGVSLRCWDQRSRRHHWHPLFLAGQSWPTTTPLELVLACSRDGQDCLELVLGQPLAEQRREVVFEADVPVLRARPAGEEQVRPWDSQPTALPLVPPGQQGQDRLRLRFAIDGQGQLVLHSEDLLSGEAQPPRLLGRVA